MKFSKTVDIYKLSREEVAKLQPGQWVIAGESDNPREHRGTFCGVKPNGIVVVAWQGNARRADGGSKEYRRALMDYAKGGRE